MSMLSTLPEQRRKGYARLCVAGLSQRLMELGITPYIMAEEGNAAAPKALFKSLGFEEVEGINVKFVGFKPALDNVDSD